MQARYAAPLLLVFFGLLSAPVSAADPSLAPAPAPPPYAVRLDYLRSPGAERCPGEQAFRDAVGAAVARDLFAASPPPLASLVVRLGRRGGGYEGQVELHDAEGAVTWTMVFPGLSHPPAVTCSSLIPALAFGIAVEVDPPAFPPMLPPAPPPVDPPALPPVLPPVAPPVPPVVVVKPPIVKPRRAPLGAPPRPFRISASPWLEFATAPRLTFGVSLGLGFRVGWFSLDFETRWDPPAASLLEDGEIETSRLVGALVPCGHVKYFAGCLLAELGPRWGVVTGAGLQGGTKASLDVSIAGRLSAEIEFEPHLALRPAVDLRVPLRRRALIVAEDPWWVAPGLDLGLGLGLVASF